MNRLQQVRRAHNALTKTLVNVQAASNIEDVLEMADLNFEVGLQELSSQVVTPEGVTQVNYSESGVVRMDNLRPIGVVGERYTPIQNRDAFAPLHFLQSEGFIEEYEQAGMLGHGQRCFVIARLNQEVHLTDEHHARIMFSTTHDGSGAFQVRALAERVWCSNQIPNLDRISARMLSIRHTSSADYRLRMVKQAVLHEMEWLDEYTQWYDKMLNTEVDIPRTSAYVNQIAPRRDPKMVAERERLNDERKQDKILARINGQYNVNIAGTVAALFQGAVEYSDYDARGRNADRILTGRDIKFKKRAWESAKALV